MAEHSPTPWRVDADMSDTSPIGAWWIASTAPTYYVGAVRKEADAALIVEAVNERDRLRDLVRRLANMAETTIPDAMENWDGFTSDRVEFEREAYDLIFEARVALGEGEQEGDGKC